MILSIALGLIPMLGQVPGNLVYPWAMGLFYEQWSAVFGKVILTITCPSYVRATYPYKWWRIRVGWYVIFTNFLQSMLFNSLWLKLGTPGWALLIFWEVWKWDQALLFKFVCLLGVGSCESTACILIQKHCTHLNVGYFWPAALHPSFDQLHIEHQDIDQLNQFDLH